MSGDRYKINDQQGMHFVTFTVVGWLDVFIRKSYKDIIVESLNFCIKEKGLKVYCWCIMTSHIHLIIGSNNKPLSDIMRDLKSHTSRELKKEILSHPQESRREWMLWMMKRAGLKNGNNKDFQFWQQHNQPLELDNNTIKDNTLE